MPRRIALVEDEPAIRANYAEALRRHGYEVTAYGERRAALEAFRARLPDLAVIDIGLGDDPEGGFALCRELRALSPQLPIVFLSARDSDFDIVSGLRLGADDYVTKDASLPQLLARIGALFRRVEALGEDKPAEERIVRGELELDLKRFSAHWKGTRIELTLTEFWMVHSLARHPGHVKSREQLMRDAELVVDDATVTSHVKRLRAKFLAADPGFDAVETAYGLGYRWRG
jgi:two-component system OmpR family response regulator